MTYMELITRESETICEFAFWSSVEGRGLHVEGEGNMSRVQKK